MYKHICILKSTTAKAIYIIGIPVLIGFLSWAFTEYRDFYSFKKESSNDIAEQKILLKEIKSAVDLIELQTARIDQKLRDRETASIRIDRQINSNYRLANELRSN